MIVFFLLSLSPSVVLLLFTSSYQQNIDTTQVGTGLSFIALKPHQGRFLSSDFSLILSLFGGVSC